MLAMIVQLPPLFAAEGFIPGKRRGGSFPWWCAVVHHTKQTWKYILSVEFQEVLAGARNG